MKVSVNFESLDNSLSPLYIAENRNLHRLHNTKLVYQTKENYADYINSKLLFHQLRSENLPFWLANHSMVLLFLNRTPLILLASIQGAVKRMT